MADLANIGFEAHMMHWDRVRELLDQRADVHQMWSGYTALQAVAAEGQLALLERLLSEGAGSQIDYQDHLGHTALTWAANSGQVEAILMLLASGADPTLADASGRSPADSAAMMAANETLPWRQQRLQEAAELLRSHAEDWTRPVVFQVETELREPEMELQLRTVGGNVAAVLQWPCAEPVKKLPEAILGALETAGFDSPIKPLRARNLRLLAKSGRLIDFGPEAELLPDQLAAPGEEHAESAAIWHAARSHSPHHCWSRTPASRVASGILAEGAPPPWNQEPG